VPAYEKPLIVQERLRLACSRRRKSILIDNHAGSQPVDQERAILIARHDALDLALTIALAGYQCRIARATAVELSLNDYRPFELPLAIPIGRLLLRGDLLEGQRDGFCHVIYGRSSGIANCGSRLCVSITAIRPW